MKITTNAHLLNSLTSLVDPNQRQQQDVQLQQEQARKKQQQAQALVNKADRQSLIDANRQALKNLQDQLKADKLEKLRADFALDKLADRDRAAAQNLNSQNLNLRESLGGGRPGNDSRPGQIIDIRV